MIEWNNLTFSYGDLTVVKDFSLQLDTPGITVFLGPSGCGKTSLLNLAAGIRIPGEGDVLNPYRDNQSYLFQKPRLLPWKSVHDNVSFALPSWMDSSEKAQRTTAILDLVGLKEFENALPGELSGGMEQRVSLARSFVYEAALLLMDEPFKGLDLKMKMPLIQLILKILNHRNTKTILVTHDVREAILMGDRIILLQGPPLKVREDLLNPCSPGSRHMENRSFYDLEHRLYHLILEDSTEA